ncbi:hypothetical protein SASPL_111691 [Salvia splendens]|uniref:Uncharacterized protein n=1 Tax=Salvia splendens TaxID=180675 RepID=A0A8X8Y7B4_SALSN|nr:hypothetical protein SASPL_111691 [Salvia splendens]
MRQRRGHAIMVAFPFQGHITPYTNLAMKLASKGILVTFVHLEFIHHKLLSSLSEPDPFSLARESGLDILAKKHNLLTVSFSTEPALAFSLTYHVRLLRENGHYPCKDNVEEEIKYVDGIKSVNTKDLMLYLKECCSSTLVHRVQMKAFDEVKKSDFILHNTVYELESDTLSALNKIQPNYAVGPISFSKNLPPSATGTLWSESGCSVWLWSKSPGSVLYC